MSYLLETLGRGLPTNLRSLLAGQLISLEGDQVPALTARAREMPASVDLSLRLGAAHLRSLRLGDARRAFETALQMPGGEQAAALGLACVHDELGEIAAAVKYLTMAQAQDPRNPTLAFALGICLERTGSTAAAGAMFESVLTIKPTYRPALHRLAALAVREKRWTDALRYYQTLSDDEPGDLETQLTLGALCLQVGRPDDACEVIRRALLVEPDISEDMLADVDTESEAERLAQSIRTLEELVRRYPGVAELHVHLGDLYLKVDRDEEAVQAFETALSIRPQFLEAAVKLGTQHLRCKRFAEASAAFNRAVELNDRLMLTFVGLGVAQERAGAHADAEATLDLAVSLAPNSTLLYSEASKLDIRAEQDDEPGETLDLSADRMGDAFDGGLDLVELDPAAPNTSDELEDAEVDELLEDALDRHEQALADHPQYADLQYRYGLLLRQTGDRKGAARAFSKALEINPQYTKALVKLGVCLRELGQTDEAREIFERTLRLDPDIIDSHYQLGLLFAQRAQFELAVEHFEAAAGADRDKREFRQQLALALQNLGLVERARETWESLNNDPRQRRLSALGE